MTGLSPCAENSPGRAQSRGRRAVRRPRAGPVQGRGDSGWTRVGAVDVLEGVRAWTSWEVEQTNWIRLVKV